MKSSQSQRDFRKLNKLMLDVAYEAIFYLQMHDRCYKQYCLQTAAWGGVDKLKDLAPSLSEPFLTPVKICLNACAEAEAKMPSRNISFEGYSVAAESLSKLSEQIDRILESNPSLKGDIKDDDLSSHALYVTLEKIVAKVT